MLPTLLEPPHVPASSATPAVSRDSQLVILDDDISSVSLLERSLRNLGFNNIRTFHQYDSLLNAAAELEPSLFFLGLDPVGLAFDYMDALKDRYAHSDPPFVFLTGAAPAQQAQRVLERGGRALFIKPYRSAEIAVQIKRLLGQRQSRQALLNTTADKAARLEQELEGAHVEMLVRLAFVVESNHAPRGRAGTTSWQQRVKRGLVV